MPQRSSSSEPRVGALGQAGTAGQAFAASSLLGSVLAQEGLGWDSCLHVWGGGTEQAGERNKDDGVVRARGRNPHRVPGTVPTCLLLFQWQ